MQNMVNNHTLESNWKYHYFYMTRVQININIDVNQYLCFSLLIILNSLSNVRTCGAYRLQAYSQENVKAP